MEYSWHVLKALVRVVRAGCGLFMPLPPMTLDDKPFKKLRVSRPPKTDLRRQSAASGRDCTSSASASSPAPASGGGVDKEAEAGVDRTLSVLPDKGMLEFSFGSFLKPPPTGQPLSANLLEKLLRELADTNLMAQASKDIVVSVMHGNFINIAQTRQLLSVNNDAEFRLLVLEANFNAFSDPHLRPALLADLAPSERKRLQRRVGPASWFFTALNPTGHYTLNLNRPMDRQVALALMAFKNREQEWEEKNAKTEGVRVGGTRDKNLDRVWRNAKFNHRPHKYENTWVLPRHGTLQLDFVQITKPSDLFFAEDIKVIGNHQLVELVATQGDAWNKNPAAFVTHVREASNGCFFTCDQVKYLLLEITKAIVIKERFSDKFGGTAILRRWTNKTAALYFTMWRMGIVLDLKRIPSLREAGNSAQVDSHGNLIPESAADKAKFEYFENLRVELVVIMFARVRDFLGFRTQIFEKLRYDKYVLISFFSKSFFEKYISFDICGEPQRSRPSVLVAFRIYRSLNYVYIGLFKRSVFVKINLY